MPNDKHNTYIDYTAVAATHLRTEAKKRGTRIGSSHAHAIVAAHLGYNSRAALLAPTAEHCLDDQWLGQAEPNKEMIRDAIMRMRDTELTTKPETVDFLALTIQDGLTPTCCVTGTHSADNIPLGDVQPGDEPEAWVHPSAAQDPDQFGYCRCCGRDVLYRVGDLDSQGLCEEHKGEFDYDEDEQKGWGDLLENLTKDG